VSWDLFFYTRAERPVAPAAILDYLRSTGLFQISPDDASAPSSFEALYDQPISQVQFTLSYSAPAADEDEAYVDSGLSANVNFVRPSFFAHEAMPIFEQIARALDLLVLDPQSEESDEPVACDAQQLIASWERSNARAVEIVLSRHGARLAYMPRERALAWWRTFRAFGVFGERLLERLGTDDLLVSTPLPAIRANGDGNVVRTAVLTLGVAQVVPDCEYFEVLRPRRHRLMRWRLDPRREPERGYVSAERALALLGGRLEPLDVSGDRHHILPAARAEETLTLFDGERLEPPTAFTFVQPTDFVDVPLPART
jgi:hypothetical protein